jgi:hypothetical protein
MRLVRTLWLTILVVGVLGRNLQAGLFFRREGTPPPGPPRMIPHTMERAGCPYLISPHARPTRTPAYEGYYVGGGSTHGGDAPCPDEGTWGWDYVGNVIPRHVFNTWNHGRRYQTGYGKYQVDGPKLRYLLHGGTAK